MEIGAIAEIPFGRRSLSEKSLLEICVICCPTTSHSALQILKAFAYMYELTGFFYLILKMPGNNSSVRSEYHQIIPWPRKLPAALILRTYPAMPLLCCVLTLLCPYFSTRLPCRTLIFLRPYPAVLLFFLYAYPAVPLFFCAFTPYTAVLTLLCSYFSSHLPCCVYPTLPLFFFALTLLRLPCCAPKFFFVRQGGLSKKQDNGTAEVSARKKKIFFSCAAG